MYMVIIKCIIVRLEYFTKFLSLVPVLLLSSSSSSSSFSIPSFLPFLLTKIFFFVSFFFSNFFFYFFSFPSECVWVFRKKKKKKVWPTDLKRTLRGCVGVIRVAGFCKPAFSVCKSVE